VRDADRLIGNPPLVIRKIPIVADHLGEVMAGLPKGHQVRGARKKKAIQRPKGNKKPSAKTSETTIYNRDPVVKAWVLESASGTCECCGADAPFRNHDGVPFLEVHHVWLLADDGPDCVENAVAVCPNCHRALHYSSDRSVIKEKLYENIDRLERLHFV
jgi:5-methylcytosine-specific restriction enzyme A